MNKKELIKNINLETKNLERLIGEMKNLLARIKEEPTFVESRAAASILHDFYSGVEKIFERVALTVDKNLPANDNWHIELLTQMAKPLTNIREPFISENLFEKLKEYLKFRHLFRHIYGFELEWDRLSELCTGLDNTLKELTREIDKFINALEDND